MPFVTETIWSEVYGKDDILMVEEYPKILNITSWNEDIVNFEMIVKRIISQIRSLRADYKIDPVKKLNVLISAGNKVGLIEENKEVIKSLARLESLDIQEKIEKPKESVGFVEGGVEVYMKLSGAIDFEKEKVRLNKEIKGLEKYVGSLDKKLNNGGFVDNAPEEVVNKEKEKLEESRLKLKNLKKQLVNLK